MKIFIHNHSNKEGIEDILKILLDTFPESSISNSENLTPNHTNIIIDEFTNIISNHKIEKFKKESPDTKLILIATEFIKKDVFLSTFNTFENIFNRSILGVLKLYLLLKRKDFNITITKIMQIILSLPLGSISILTIFISYLFSKYILRSSRLHKLNFYMYFVSIYQSGFYLMLRYESFIKMSNLFNAVICLHPAMEKSYIKIFGNDKIYGTIYPRIDKSKFNEGLKNKSVFGFYLSGTLTRNRTKLLNSFSRLIIFSGLKKKCHNFLIQGFGKKEKQDINKLSSSPKDKFTKEDLFFSLHPYQTRSWPYFSPTRIYRSLSYDHNLPIVFETSNEHPLESLVFLFRDQYSLLELNSIFENRDNFLIEYNKKIDCYNKDILENNNKIIKKLNASA
jgi:hypothetical protein